MHVPFPSDPIRQRNHTIAYGSTRLELPLTLRLSLRHVVCNMKTASQKPKSLSQPYTYLSPEKYGTGSDEACSRSPPAHKRHKSSASAASPTRMSAQISSSQPPVSAEGSSAQAATVPSPANPRKRRISNNTGSPSTALTAISALAETAVATAPSETPETATKKKGRTNTPWTPEEEQKLQQMRGENKGWSEIAKVK